MDTDKEGEEKDKKNNKKTSKNRTPYPASRTRKYWNVEREKDLVFDRSQTNRFELHSTVHIIWRLGSRSRFDFEHTEERLRETAERNEHMEHKEEKKIVNRINNLLSCFIFCSCNRFSQVCFSSVHSSQHVRFLRFHPWVHHFRTIEWLWWLRPLKQLIRRKGRSNQQHCYSWSLKRRLQRS